MARALTLQTIKYILDEDKKLTKDKQTIFILKPLSAKENAELIDGMKFTKAKKGKKKIDDDDIDILNKGSYLYQLLCYGLIGWENFFYEDDKLAEWTNDIEENLNKISSENRMELSTKIAEISNPERKQSKN
jgi:hypothetical protein